MPRITIVLASIAISTLSAWPASGGMTPGRERPDQLQFVFPHNVDCRDFERTGLKVWQTRHRSSIDLGNWDGSFEISGPIARGAFVLRGFDLVDILESRCGLMA